jgi:hypothetical protein
VLDVEEVHAWQAQQVDQGELADLEELRPCPQQELSRREQPGLHSKHNRISFLFRDDRVKGKDSKVQVETRRTNGYIEQRSKICFYSLAPTREGSMFLQIILVDETHVQIETGQRSEEGPCRSSLSNFPP